MTRTTVIGAFDHGIYGAVERVTDHLAAAPEGKARQVLWRIYSKRAILAAGSIERPIAFANNDRPGIMQAGAVRAYANRWAVTAASDVAVFTNNDDGHRTAGDLCRQGCECHRHYRHACRCARSCQREVFAGACVTDSRGRLGLSKVRVRFADGSQRWIKCGALGVSGGWNPNVHLTCHQRGRPVWDETIAAFVPGAVGPAGLSSAGAALGMFSTAAALTSGAAAAVSALGEIGIKAKAIALPAGRGRASQHQSILACQRQRPRLA